MATRRTSGSVIEGRSSDGETAPRPETGATVSAYLVEEVERLRIRRAYWKTESKKLKESNEKLKSELERRSRAYAELERTHDYVLHCLHHLSRKRPRVEREDENHGYSPMSPPYVPPQQMVNGGYTPASPPYAPPNQDPIRENEESENEGSINTIPNSDIDE